MGYQFGVYDCGEITDIGLEVNSNLCGQGLGFEFFSRGLEFARNNLSAKRFRLTVATFNLWAINVYQRAGFKKDNYFMRKTETGKMDFWVMILY